MESNIDVVSRTVEVTLDPFDIVEGESTIMVELKKATPDEINSPLPQESSVTESPAEESVVDVTESQTESQPVKSVVDVSGSNTGFFQSVVNTIQKLLR
jgi:hypothetical protein